MPFRGRARISWRPRSIVASSEVASWASCRPARGGSIPAWAAAPHWPASISTTGCPMMPTSFLAAANPCARWSPCCQTLRRKPTLLSRSCATREPTFGSPSARPRPVLKWISSSIPTPAVESSGTRVEGVVVESLADLRANKLTCLLSRSEPRDLVDLLFLDRAGYPPERDLMLALRKDAGLDPKHSGLAARPVSRGASAANAGSVRARRAQRIPRRSARALPASRRARGERVGQAIFHQAWVT